MISHSRVLHFLTIDPEVYQAGCVRDGICPAHVGRNQQVTPGLNRPARVMGIRPRKQGDCTREGWRIERDNVRLEIPCRNPPGTRAGPDASRLLVGPGGNESPLARRLLVKVRGPVGEAAVDGDKGHDRGAASGKPSLQS
jgi:hypothetical protein